MAMQVGMVSAAMLSIRARNAGGVNEELMHYREMARAGGNRREQDDGMRNELPSHVFAKGARTPRLARAQGSRAVIAWASTIAPRLRTDA